MLAKFQCPTDTPLNHKLPQLLIKNLISIKNGSTCEFNFKVLPFNY
ncbi:hypothetical protein [uncultured Ruminococcus sp.]|nr:hypothetical protein [uncultured Ruminococcus sp.]